MGKKINRIGMFKKFTVDENVSSTSQIKNSAQRGIQAAIISQYPRLEPIIDEILPKKSMMVAKCQVGSSSVSIISFFCASS